jgi:hypothetical protein
VGDGLCECAITDVAEIVPLDDTRRYVALAAVAARLLGLLKVHHLFELKAKQLESNRCTLDHAAAFPTT